jgi:predicted Fe-Mo cluster-binding NifX family protein
MRIAVPTFKGNLCAHFGHCELFTLFEIDKENRKIVHTEEMVPPHHEPGILPQWLREKEVDLVIAGGMGRRAQDLFCQYGIECIVGVSPENAVEVITSYLNDQLTAGENLCDH